MKDEHQLQSCAFVHRLFSQEKTRGLRYKTEVLVLKKYGSQKENGLQKM